MNSTPPSTASVLRESPSRLHSHRTCRSEVAPALTIRELSKHGDFVRSVVCKPNTVTVLVSSNAEDLEHLKGALAGRSSLSTVSLRSGGREMHPSEVYAFGAQATMFERARVSEALHFAGAPEWAIADLLSQIDLQEHASSLVRHLDECAVRRLALVCSLFNKAQVVFWEDPFSLLTPVWVERMAALLLLHVQKSAKIFVATGIVRLPSAWNNTSTVSVEALQPWKRRKKSFSTSAEPGTKDLVAQMRELMDAVRVVEENTNAFITRPMLIKRSGVKTTGQLEFASNEVIANPQADPADALAQHRPFARVMSALNSATRWKVVPAKAAGAGESAARSLLRPSFFEKLTRRSIVYRYCRRALWRCGSWFSQADLYNALPACKAGRVSERERLATHLLQPLLFVLILLCVIRFFG